MQVQTEGVGSLKIRGHRRAAAGNKVQAKPRHVVPMRVVGVVVVESVVRGDSRQFWASRQLHWSVVCWPP